MFFPSNSLYFLKLYKPFFQLFRQNKSLKTSHKKTKHINFHILQMAQTTQHNNKHK